MGLTALLAVSIPVAAHAAFFGLFTTAEVSAAAKPVASSAAPSSNSQTMMVLTAPENPADATPAAPISVIGGTALLADASADGDAAAIAKQVPDQIAVYEVRVGDTLSQIAGMYGVSVNTIKWANDLTGPVTPGQRLVILPITGVSHTVVKGDTVATVAKKYGADADEIRTFNDIADDLAVGQIILVPDGEIATKSSGSSVAKAPARVGVGRTVATTASAGGVTFTRPVVGTKTQGIHGHNGIDIGASAGTRVSASAGGTVIIAKASGWNGGYGSYVVIDHGGGVQTLYAHLSSVEVAVGDSIGAGNRIGAVGNTGKSTGNHLHFEVRGGTNPF